jgi:hypothetical protein
MCNTQPFAGRAVDTVVFSLQHNFVFEIYKYGVNLCGRLISARFFAPTGLKGNGWLIKTLRNGCFIKCSYL